MAFNNPSSRTPVSYGSATKSLGYIVGTIGRAFSSDDDEGAHLLNKKKAKGESRFMAGACCCCLLVLTGTVGGFIWALQSMTYPGEIPKGVRRILAPHVPRVVPAPAQCRFLYEDAAGSPSALTQHGWQARRSRASLTREQEHIGCEQEREAEVAAAAGVAGQLRGRNGI